MSEAFLINVAVVMWSLCIVIVTIAIGAAIYFYRSSRRKKVECENYREAFFNTWGHYPKCDN